MKNFSPFNPGDPISAAKLNKLAAYAGASQSSMPTTPGTYFNSERTNADSESNQPSVILVFATEDFQVQETDHAITDDCPSGLCNFVDLIRSTNTYTPQLTGRDFYVHDPVAGFTGAASKSQDDVFHAVWNKNSKRWEALGTAGSLRIVYGITRVCLADGWYEIEITDWAEEPPIDSNSLSSSVSASVSDDPCDLCPTDAEWEADTECESLSAVEVTRPTGTPTGEYVYGHTAETLPLAIGGLVKMIKRVTPAASGSVSTSVSDTPITDLYDIVDSQKPLISLPFPQYECCTLPGGGQEVRLVQCNRAIVAGVMCIGPYTPCPASDSASESV